MSTPAPAKKARGRPTISDDQRRDDLIKIRANAEEKTKFEAVGGTEWFRAALKRAKVKERSGTPEERMQDEPPVSEG